jgi:glutamine amidotransferase
MITIVDYGLGNLASIQNMCRRLGIESRITADKGVIAASDRLVLPGVGHFRKGMENLRNSGLDLILDDLVRVRERPILGICLGAQLMTAHSEEGDVDGLGWVDAVTVGFDTSRLGGRKVPHMGWADIAITDAADPLWKDLPEESRFYFVHAYHFRFSLPQEVSATAVYGYDFACAFRKGNIHGVQFHPEKSHKFGMRVLSNFAKS